MIGVLARRLPTTVLLACALAGGGVACSRGRTAADAARGDAASAEAGLAAPAEAASAEVDRVAPADASTPAADVEIADEDAAPAPPAPPAEPPSDPWPTTEPCRMAARLTWSASAGRMSLPPTPPTPIDGLDAVAIAIDPGWNACVVEAGGGASCWGISIRGALGDDPEGRARPGRIPGLADVAEIRPADSHACACLADGTVNCFGTASDGRLGPALTEGWTETPVGVPGLAGVARLAVGFGFGCALGEDAVVRCWGRNDAGQLGDGTRENRAEPAPVVRLRAAAAIAAAGEQVCAVLPDRTVRCWGDMVATMCGDAYPTPVDLPDAAGVAEVAVGWDHACLRLEDGTVRCWGGDEGGQLGIGWRGRQYLPVTVPDLSGVVRIAAGEGVTCAIREDRTVRCWGKNHCGQVDGGASGALYLDVPTVVPGLADVRDVAVGAGQTCALREDGSVWCWGATTPEQIGACLHAGFPE